MDGYRAYRYTLTPGADAPEAALTAYARRSGHPATVALAHPAEAPQLAARLASVRIATVAHGGPLRGEIWLADEAA